MRDDILQRKDEIFKWVANHWPNAKIARELNCKVDTLKAYYKKLGIVYSGNPGCEGFKSDPKRLPIELYVKSNATNSQKRIRLIKDKVKEKKCELCGNTEWLGEPIPLELHHKDYNHYNNELNNLMIVCPNCHIILHHNNNSYGK